MKHTCLVALVGLVALAPSIVSAEELRVAVLVGNNVGERPDRSLRFAEDEVERLAGILQEKGGFQRIELVQGGDRAAVEARLREMDVVLAAAKKAGQRTLFLFYYSGHGTKEALELGQSQLPLRDLRQHLEQLPSDVRLAFVDACQSGALTGVKGGKRAPAYEVRLADPGAVEGLAIVTSSTSNELSQESDELRGSFFSHNVMAGLQGLADTSGDGQVTLSELYDYTFKRTLASTAASLVGSQHPTRVYKLSGAGDVVLSRTRPSDAKLVFPRERAATYSIMRGQHVTAELATNNSEELYITLPAGDYQIVRRSLEGVTSHKVVVDAGHATRVEPGDMAPVLAQNVSRKKAGDAGVLAGRLEPDFQVRRHHIEAHVGAQNGIVTGSPSVLPALGAAYGLRVGAVVLQARAELVSFDATRGAAASSHLRVVPSLEALFTAFTAGRFALLAGPSLGLAVVRQTGDFVPAGQTAALSYGLCYGGFATARLRLTETTSVTTTAFGGAEVFKVNQAAGASTEHKPLVGLSVGAAYAF
jgi:hypothetical protein